MDSIFRFSEAAQQQVKAAVQAAEKMTSGEIRVFIDHTCDGDVLDRAAFVFRELGMENTEARNGVLIYLATHSRKFAIIGDSGIHSKVGDDFWLAVKSEMQRHFVLGDFVTGLCNGIRLAGAALREHFPYTDGDKNELPDDITFGNR